MRASPTTGRSVREVFNGATAPSCLPSSSSLPQPPLLPRHAPAAAPAPTAGVFAGIHSRPGSPRRQPHEQLTRSGSCAFLSDLFDTERLFELRDFLLARVMPKGEAVEQFAASI